MSGFEDGFPSEDTRVELDTTSPHTGCGNGCQLREDMAIELANHYYESERYHANASFEKCKALAYEEIDQLIQSQRPQAVEDVKLSVALEKQLKAFQHYTASWGYPMNQEAHARGLATAVADVMQTIQSRCPQARKDGELNKVLNQLHEAGAIGSIINDGKPHALRSHATDDDCVREAQAAIEHLITHKRAEVGDDAELLKIIDERDKQKKL